MQYDIVFGRLRDMKQNNNYDDYDEIRGRETVEYIKEFAPIHHIFSKNIDEYDSDDYIEEE